MLREEMKKRRMQPTLARERVGASLVCSFLTACMPASSKQCPRTSAAAEHVQWYRFAHSMTCLQPDSQQKTTPCRHVHGLHFLKCPLPVLRKTRS